MPATTPYPAVLVLVLALSLPLAALGGTGAPPSPLCRPAAEVDGPNSIDACEVEDLALVQVHLSITQQARNHLNSNPLPEQASDDGKKSDVQEDPEDDRRSLAGYVKALVVHLADVGVSSQRIEDVLSCVYPVFAVLAIGIVTYLNHSKGCSAVLVILTFMCCVASSKIACKWALADFPFPTWLTMLTFVGATCVTACIIICRCWLLEAQFPLPSRSEFAHLYIPAAVAFSLAICCGNQALSYNSAAFVEMLGSTSCFFTAIMVVLLGLPFSQDFVLPLLVVAGGTAVAAAGELECSPFGVLLCFASNALMSLYVALVQKIFAVSASKQGGKSDPCTVLFWLSIPASSLLLGLALTTEGREPFVLMAAYSTQRQLACILEVAFFCTVSVALLLTGFSVIRQIGGLANMVLLMAAGVLTVMGGIVLLHEVVTLLQFIGYVVMLSGVYWFTTVSQKEAGPCDGHEGKVAGG